MGDSQERQRGQEGQTATGGEEDRGEEEWETALNLAGQPPQASVDLAELNTMAVGWLTEGGDVKGMWVLQRTSSVSWQTVVSLFCICLNRVSSSVLSSCSVLTSDT